MKTKEIAELKKYYEEMREAIRASFMIDRNVDVEGDSIDQVQGASICGIQEQLSLRDVNRLRSIDDALKRMTEGSFGICEECGEDIGKKRLRALPGVKLCITCAEKAEVRR